MIGRMLRCFGMVLSFFLFWKSPEVNKTHILDITHCIYEDKNKKKFLFQTQQKYYFKVNFVGNTNPNCINPYFPMIHITTDAPHDAWVHVVYTDCPYLKTFIDSAQSAYPYYTYAQDFYDAPLWRYTLLHKPLSFWTGHAFAVKIDQKRKTIQCVGGIEWGFSLHRTRLRPVPRFPKMLDQKAWKNAWKALQDQLPGYTCTVH